MKTIRHAIKQTIKPFKPKNIEWDDENGHHEEETKDPGPFCFSEFCVSVMGVFLLLYFDHPDIFTTEYELSAGKGSVLYTPAGDPVENAKALFSGHDFMGHAKLMVTVNSFMRWLFEQDAVEDYEKDAYWYMPPTLINMWNAYAEASDGDIFRGPEV